MIKLNTLNNYILFTEDNGDASAIGKLSLTYKIEDEDITFFVLKEGNNKIYTVPFISSAIKNLEVDGIIYSKEDLPTALGNIFLPPSGSGSSGEVTPSDIVYLQQQINVIKANTNRAYVIATYEDDVLTLITLAGIETKLNIPYFDASKYYLKSEIDTLLSAINTKINAKADRNDVYTKSEIDDKFDEIDIDPSEIAAIEADIEDLKAGTISKVVYTALDGKLVVTDYRGNATTYTIPYFDASKYYNKTEVDNKITTATGDINTTINTKLADYYKKTETYSKTQVDAKINAIPTFDSDDYYKKSEVDTKLGTKANSTDVYTKTSIDGLLATKANQSTTYTKTEVDAKITAVNTSITNVDNKFADYTKTTDLTTLLAGKADKSTTYTKTQVDDLIAGIDVPDVDDYYTKSEVDTKLGTKANVGDSYTKSETDTKLSAKANSSDVYTKTATDGLLSSKANSSDVYTKAQTYTQAQVNTLLNDKANVANVYIKSEVYSKSEVDNKLLTYDTDITNIENKFDDYYTKTQSDAKYVTKNTYTSVTVSGASTTCDFSIYDYFHLILTGSGAVLNIIADNLPEFGKPYYITVNNSRPGDVELNVGETITGELPVVKMGGIAEISAMKWGDDTIKATFIVSA